MTNTDRYCWDCKYFEVDIGEQAERLPGGGVWDARQGDGPNCSRWVWRVGEFGSMPDLDRRDGSVGWAVMNVDDFRRAMESASHCDLFEERARSARNRGSA